MDILLNKIVKEHNRLLSTGKEPDSLFLNESSRKELARQAALVFQISEESASVEFLGMTIYVSDRYRENQFQIYCKLPSNGEF